MLHVVEYGGWVFKVFMLFFEVFRKKYSQSKMEYMGFIWNKVFIILIFVNTQPPYFLKKRRIVV